MASELKPWRYEIKYGPDGEDSYSWVYDDHGAMVATMKTHKAKQIVDAMNTRPAPVATDTVHADDIAVDRFAIAMKEKLAKKREEGRGGWENKEECSAEYLSYLLIQHIWKGDPIDVANLAMMLQQRGDRIVIDSETSPIVPRHPAATDTGLETVEYQVRSKLNGHWVKDNFLSQQLSPDTERRELVTRSQAGAIIAELQAKAKDYREYSERLIKRLESEEAMRSQAEELLAAERADHDNTIATLSSLIEDNAALTARIKELDRCHEGTIDLCNQKTAQIEALEAKLTAAEKALKPFANAADGRKSKNVTGSVCFSQHYLLAARAVLGGKPS